MEILRPNATGWKLRTIYPSLNGILYHIIINFSDIFRVKIPLLIIPISHLFELQVSEWNK